MPYSTHCVAVLKSCATKVFSWLRMAGGAVLAGGAPPSFVEACAMLAAVCARTPTDVSDVVS